MKLQDPRTVKKIVQIDDHICLAFAGLVADARVLINRARIESQSYRLTVDEAPSVEYITRWIAGRQQKYTQSGGVRPFGISTLVVGFDTDGEPRLFQTDPSGIYSEWYANCIGRNSKNVKEFLIKNYPGLRREKIGEGEEEDEKVDFELTDEATIRLTVKALMEVVESPKNVEIGCLRRDGKITYLSETQIESLVDSIEKEKEKQKEER
eukprot:TRINITY_DN1505_c0_g2_i3.p1 TRINITY_DN1505_c0_g2~~TRINITY_DN1505_c0_g2_i3.p1  ORF type:complete len:209 (+),score=51.50 TRINITY_DN1505_c0_g2_i3:331-957(+)